MKKLTIKQQRFVDEYLICGNATEAARRAGYKHPNPTGSENLAKPSIRERIDQRIAEKEEASIAKQDEVLKYLTSLMRGEQQEETLIGTGGGEQTITSIDVSARERLRAAELLGRRYRLFTDRQEMTGDMALRIEVDYGEDDPDSE
ncbi:MAG: terminase small subunit [Bacillota bacterium]|nr:terminase small subunit [Bacillota bacterium]